MPGLDWQKSSYSGGPEGNCLYVAAESDGTIHLRESDAPHEILTAAPAQLTALLDHIKREPRRPAP
ncbi:DUF397 domain-containing protein [Streptomyces sp. NBC_01381]|uniref:DUF397 domain-containing protein n=1 Tax=Streptomyces sp. NBC_01381 TaxID=2903845 RepID=UPI002256715F|nr:DUF397 domain-containing protein [Streptomyces sp. NBC_01381]MCX4665602.1 DUF397 domain-containing protein [Streptomyces sp. NBC_01381]